MYRSDINFFPSSFGFSLAFLLEAVVFTVVLFLLQELLEHLGIRLLNERLNDPTMQDSFESIFPRDNPKNTRFSINFFTSIRLGGITENLREVQYKSNIYEFKTN